MNTAIKRAHRNMMEVIGKGEIYSNDDKWYTVVKDSWVDSFGYLNKQGLEVDLLIELTERNQLRLWEPYISNFRREVEEAIMERLAAKKNHSSNVVTQKQEKLVKGLYLSGYSTRAISEALAGTISHSKVAEIVKGLPKYDMKRRGQVVELLDDIRGLDIRKYVGSGKRDDFRNNSNNKKTKTEKIDDMHKLYKAGFSIRAIAQNIKVPETTVNNYIDRYFKLGFKGYSAYDKYKEEKSK